MLSIKTFGLFAACLLLLSGQTHSSERSIELAMKEYELALSLEPDLENGKRIYSQCAVCHDPEGWGRQGGNYPQIAGQLRSVVVKQLADIRAGNRGNPVMFPFSTSRVLKSAQDIADVSAYVAQLKMTPNNGKGPNNRLVFGKALYEEFCTDCHGENGEGDVKKHIPLIQGQHFNYLVRQFNWIRIGRRANADKEMVEQIQSFHPGDVQDVLSYVSWLQPPADKLADTPMYRNPDFANAYSRSQASQYRSQTQMMTGKQQQKHEEFLNSNKPSE